MSVMKRLSGVVQAKANKMLDRVEDPRDTLDLSYEKQLEQLQQVRKGLADIATARKRIELQATQLKSSADKLQDQAKTALSQNNEDLAREALSRRAAIATQLEQLKTQHDQLVSQQDRLVTTSQQLEARVAAFRTQKETLKASYTAAEAQTKIGEAVSGISESMGDTGLAMQRAQDKIEQMQARGQAMDELLASGDLTDITNTSDPIQSQLDKASQQSQVDADLAKLKGQLAGPPAAGAIAAAEAQDASEPQDAEVVGEDEAKDAAGASPSNDPFSLDDGSSS
jgi:phage shock protein A